MKRWSVLQLFIGMRVFPGEIAGASLKRAGIPDREARSGMFSPAKSPGPH